MVLHYINSSVIIMSKDALKKIAQTVGNGTQIYAKIQEVFLCGCREKLRL